MPLKRLLLTSSPSSSPPPPPRRRRLSPTTAAPALAAVHGCAYLSTTDPVDGRRIELWITPGRNLFVGRDVSLCHYVVHSPVVSAAHVRLFATKTDEDRTLVCIEGSPSTLAIGFYSDLSRNGLLINGRLLQTKSAILLPDDVISFRAVAQDFTLRLPSRAGPPLPPSSSSSSSSVYARSSSDPASALASRVSLSLSLGSPRPSPMPAAPAARPLPPPMLRLGQYTVREDVILGSGSFGVVRLGWDGQGRQVACKSVVKARLQTTEDVRRLRNEIVLGLRADHPNLNRVLGAIDDEDDAAGGDGGFYHLFLQLVTGGDLFTYIESFTLRGRRLGEGECKYLTYQILQGVKYLHELGVAHRDLKPENVLLKHGGSFPTVLICDFGLATPFRSPTSVSAKIKAGSVPLPRVTPGAVRAPSILGTPLYFPPEYIVAKHEQELASSRRRLKLEQRGRPPAVAQGGGHLDATALDVWAIGVIAWIMTTGTHPFGNDDGPARPSLNAALSAIDSDGLSSSLEISSLEAAIQRRSFDRRVVAGDHYPNPALASYDPSAGAFLAALLHPKARERVTVGEALALEWMTLQPERALIERAWDVRVRLDGRRQRVAS